MERIEKIVVASRNPAKIDYYKEVLKSIAKEVLGLNEFDIAGKPEETGKTAEENAAIKASFYCGRLGLPVFSEDEALYVDFLPEDKQPGTHVRRINGIDEVDDETLIRYWEEIIALVPKENRTGKWHFAYCVTTPNGKPVTISLDQGVLFFSPSSKIRIPGWPMSSLQGSKVFGKPHSEQTLQEKDISQKRLALKLTKLLEQQLCRLLSNY